MKKRYIFGVVILLIVIAFFVSVLYSLDRKEENITNAWFPKVGQKLWTYNMNKYEWKKAPDNVAENMKLHCKLSFRKVTVDILHTIY